MFIKKWESFSSDIELGSEIFKLKISDPFLYDAHELRGVKTKIFRIETKLENRTIASSNYFNPDPKSDIWDSYLLGVKEEYRKDPNFLNLAILMRLLTFGILGRKTARSQDLSESGNAFVKKWEKIGIWKSLEMTQTLTDWGLNQSEKFCKEFLNIEKINWK